MGNKQKKSKFFIWLGLSVPTNSGMGQVVSLFCNFRGQIFLLKLLGGKGIDDGYMSMALNWFSVMLCLGEIKIYTRELL